MCFSATEIPLHELETRAAFELALEILAFEHFEVALVADINPFDAEFRRLTALAQALQDMRCDPRVDGGVLCHSLFLGPYMKMLEREELYERACSTRAP